MGRAFHFVSEAHLVRYTGFRAENLRDLRRSINRVSGSSIFYHTYHALFRRHILQGEFVNDFARWVAVTLREDILGERLAAVDPLDESDVHGARHRIGQLIDRHLGQTEYIPHARRGQEFYFQEALTVVYPTGLSASTLEEFERIIRTVRPDVMFHHYISCRLRIGKQENDFSAWLEGELGESQLADEIRNLSPYRYNLLTLREAVGDTIRRELDARS